MISEYCRNCDWAIKRFNLDKDVSMYVIMNTLADAVRKSDESQNKKGEEDGKSVKRGRSSNRGTAGSC